MYFFAAGLSYQGGAYHGWQKQQHDPCTVQAQVEAALSSIAAAPVETVVAGRTDAGVHALAQVIHFVSPHWRREDAWLRGANSILPPDIRFYWVKPVSEDFHARYSARARSYRYLIWNAAQPSAVFHAYTLWHRRPLDISRMQTAAQVFLGEHDFSSFQAADCQSKTPMRCVHRVDFQRSDSLICMDIQANAFLHHMIRNMVGVLLSIGDGRRPSSWCADVLEARDRRCAGITAAPQGLYLTAIDYPEHFAIPQGEAFPDFIMKH